MVSIDRIYKTKAYDKLEAYCDDEQGGDYENCMIADKYDRQAVINLLIPIIRKEERERLKPKYNSQKTQSAKCDTCNNQSDGVPDCVIDGICPDNAD